jgi:hypothetical protein
MECSSPSLLTEENMKKTTTGHYRVLFEGNATDVKFHALLERMQDRLPEGPLFTTDAKGLFAAYLKSFPAAQRQYHNCNECRHFMERFGGLVTITSKGQTVPALWHEDDADSTHVKAYAALHRIVRKAKVTGVFLSSEKVLQDTGGNPVWEHFRVRQYNVYKNALKTADQAMAEKLEDFKNVSRALDEFPEEIVKQAVSLLESDALYRSEKVLGQAQFLADLHAVKRTTRARANYIWRAVATAPAGFCHPRSSMIGTLLEDLAAGVPFREVSRRFQEKMHPLQYQRPTAPPKAGNVLQAEKIVEQLNAAGALRRRFARLDEVETLWEPSRVAVPASGVFGHLLPQPEQYRGGSQTLTWHKFQRDILPHAVKIEAVVPYTGNYSALVTAAVPGSTPILQWDNPFSWYVYNGGSRAHQWGLSANAWVRVNAIVDSPQNWNGGYAPHQGERVFFILNGAKDSGQPTACLFPEILKSDFHPIRHTIEAYSRRAGMEDYNQASACGLCLTKSGFNVRVRVLDRANVLSEYVIDRWE